MSSAMPWRSAFSAARNSTPRPRSNKARRRRAWSILSRVGELPDTPFDLPHFPRQTLGVLILYNHKILDVLAAQRLLSSPLEPANPERFQRALSLSRDPFGDTVVDITP